MGFFVNFLFFKVRLRLGLYTSLHRKEKAVVKRIKAIAVVIFLIICIWLIKKIFSNHISTLDEFQNFMSGYGITGPIVLVLIQAFQVIVPILPGYLGCAVGAMSYGTLIGFLCNYIGISAGSMIAFLLAEKYGKVFMVEMFSKKTYEKWIRKIAEKKSYNSLFFMANLLPLFPADFLCYFSGMIHMNRKHFIWIILLSKPWCILAYSIAFGMIR